MSRVLVVLTYLFLDEETWYTDENMNISGQPLFFLNIIAFHSYFSILST